jgi:hypothetical protein
MPLSREGPFCRLTVETRIRAQGGGGLAQLRLFRGGTPLLARNARDVRALQKP